MKKVFRVSGFLLLLLIVAFGILLLYVKYSLPYAGEVKELQVEITPQKIERGAYLANNVSVCIDCHSVRDWSKYSGPIVPGSEGKGGEYFGDNMGLPGDFYARNITPFNLKGWTDGELYHLITTGISKNGEAMFPIMPYASYGKMVPEDVEALIAYLRSLESIESTQPERKVHFPMNFIINTIPKEAAPMKRTKPSDGLKYGEYLTTIAACADCHSPQENGVLLEGMDFAGGFEFRLPGGVLRSANITPDETGIGFWTKEAFVERFKYYSDSSNIVANLSPEDFNTVMPWTMYAGMTEEDLGAIYEYLMSLKPVKNKIERFTPNK